MTKRDQKSINAVIGFPLKHSLSPKLHNYIYGKLGLRAKFIKIPSKDISKAVAKIKGGPIGLCAVTMPHKQTVLKFLHKIDNQAKEINAVNTVINRNGKLYGYNTDVNGIALALKQIKIAGKNVLILGAGGAATAAGYFIAKQKGKIYWLNRTANKAKVLAKKFGGKVINNKALNKNRFDLILNTTPVGMSPNINATPLFGYEFNSKQTVFDIVYNPPRTKLLKDAKSHGAKIINGLEMFIAQGIKQDELWMEKKIMTQKLINQLKKKLI